VHDWVASIEGLDCSRPETVASALPELQEAFRDFHILVFPDQQLSPDELASFSRSFGELEHPLNARYAHPENEHVLILSNEILPDGSAVGVVDAGTDWHSDSSHERLPAKATILQSVRKPAAGGDTLYCNMTSVYEGLPQEIRDQIDGRQGVHDGSKLNNRRVQISANRPGALEDYKALAQKRTSVLQPLVRTHPETGRRSLYASPRFTVAIDGMDDEIAQPLLDTLFEHMLDERHHYRHVWGARDVVMWDNRCLNHRATGALAPGDIRRMHRTVLVGDEAYFDPDDRPRHLL